MVVSVKKRSVLEYQPILNNHSSIQFYLANQTPGRTRLLFVCLQRTRELLLVHGRWNYNTLPQLLFQTKTSNYLFFVGGLPEVLGSLIQKATAEENKANGKFTLSPSFVVGPYPRERLFQVYCGREVASRDSLK